MKLYYRKRTFFVLLLCIVPLVPASIVGSTVAYHFWASVDTVRDVAKKLEPYQLQLRVIEQGIEAETAKVKELAMLSQQQKAHIQSVDESVEQLEHQQERDRLILTDLRDYLSKAPSSGSISIGGKTFSRLELEHDVATSLIRFQAHRQQFDSAVDYREQLRKKYEEVRSEIAQRMDTLGQLKFQAELASQIIEQQRITSSFGASATSHDESLQQLAKNMGSLLSTLQSREAANTVIDEARGGAATPVADEVRRQRMPALTDQLDQALRVDTASTSQP